ncbi:MAG TPA: response regulator [Candidatus Eisenbacteria bacterium]|jgi:PAS domain S-box-containing protein
MLAGILLAAVPGLVALALTEDRYITQLLETVSVTLFSSEVLDISDALTDRLVAAQAQLRSVAQLIGDRAPSPAGRRVSAHPGPAVGTDGVEFYERLRDAFPAGSDFAALSILDAAGRPVGRVDVPGSPPELQRNLDLSQAVGPLASGETRVFPLPVGPPGRLGSLTLAIASPLRLGRDRRAVLVGILNPLAIFQRVSSAAASGGRNLFLADASGRIVAWAEGGREAAFGDSIPASLPASMMQTIAAGGHDLVWRGTPFLLTHASVELDTQGRNPTWVVGEAMPRSALFVNVREVRRRTITVLVLIVLASIALAFLLARQITRPLFRLRAGAERIASGDLEHALPAEMDDEAGEVARAFEIMRENLRASRAALGHERRMLKDRVVELNESEERFRSLSASSPIGIFENDVEGRCVYTNARWRAISGLSSEESLGTGWSRAIDPEDRVSVLAEWQRTVGSGGEFSREFRIRTPEQVLRWIHSRAAPIHSAEGSTRGYVGTVEDVTEQKRVEADLVQAREAALAAARLKSEFMANMSHEIRTPMTSIIGMTELALDTELSADQRTFLAAVKNSADALLSLLNDILDFSKIEAGKLELETIPFSLRECLGSAVKAMAVRAYQRGLEMPVDIAADVPDRLIGDPTRLRQVILNLLGNAIKFTAQGEVVLRVVAESESDAGVALRFSVEDTGIGIPEPMQKFIFESFTQADGSTTRRHGGTGLGLTICRQLVTLMGGEIGVQSAPNHGSTFTFTVSFPVEVATGSAPMTDVPLRDRRVLVVENNASSRSIFVGLLEGWQARTMATEDGAAALAALRQARDAGDPFALVLVDAHLPGMDGVALAEQIQGDGELATPIILLTTIGRSGDAARCRSLGIAGYLTKPVLAGELLEAIRAVFAGSAKGRSPVLVTRHSLREDRRRLRLLLAEDNQINRMMVTRMLEKRGHYVRAAEDGHAVLKALEAEPFDLVLMDVQMPGLDGFETTVAIRERERATGCHLPIIALTAHALKGDRERCLEHGMDGYASKPIRAAELFAAIEALIPPQDQPVEPSLSMPDAGPALRVFDLHLAMLSTEGDRAVLAEAVRLHLSHAPQQLESMEAALLRGDSQALERGAHSLRGAVAALGAKAVAEAARRLESVAATGDLEASAPALGALETEIRRLAPVLQSVLEAA